MAPDPTTVEAGYRRETPQWLVWRVEERVGNLNDTIDSGAPSHSNIGELERLGWTGSQVLKICRPAEDINDIPQETEEALLTED